MSFALYVQYLSLNFKPKNSWLASLTMFSSPFLLLVQGLGDAVGGVEENQRVLLVLGGHVSFHQQQPAVAAWRAQRRRLLRLPG